MYVTVYVCASASAGFYTGGNQPVDVKCQRYFTFYSSLSLHLCFVFIDCFDLFCKKVDFISFEEIKRQFLLCVFALMQCELPGVRRFKDGVELPASCLNMPVTLNALALTLGRNCMEICVSLYLKHRHKFLSQELHSRG